MLNLNSIGALSWITAVFLVAVTVGTILLWRQPGNRRLMRLSFFACLLALIFAPLMRAVPERVGIPFFLIGLWPTLAIIAVSAVASAVQVIQTRSPRALLSLVLSVLAAGLFYINSTTAWIWPYKTH